ncbi:hypothetical protein [Microbacterium sp. 2RAF4]|uniref:hypothetical protein n=1 Tax=Microbacterium sp. 2RAF4 TaxID=3232999 RepID=UPI003F981A15
MRIKTPAAKVGYLLVFVIGITLTAFPLAAISYELGFAWATVALVAAVVVAARTFRGAGESDAPRPWWKMTSTRGSALLLSAFFLIQGVAASFGAFGVPDPTLVLIGGVVALVIGAFYLHSALRVQQPVEGAVPAEN